MIENKSIHLYQKASSDRIKHLLISTHGHTLRTIWYTSKDGVDGAKQETNDIIEGLNKGKLNETTTIQQCHLEFDRKVKKKMDDGYVVFGTQLNEIKNTTIDITQKLPTSFAPSKPISEKPIWAINKDTIAEKKFNGICLLMHDTGTEKIAYTRKVIDITNIVTVVPDVHTKLNSVPSQSIVVGELIAIDKNGKEDLRPLKALTTEKTTAQKAAIRYSEHIINGYTFQFKPYEIYFYKGKDVTKLPFIERNAILEEIFGKRDISYGLTKEMLVKAKEMGWEGYILRHKDSTVEFTLNGKPKRTGAWKYKFTETADCFVIEATLGSGKHKNRYTHFHLGQYDSDGNLIDCGWAGPGTLTESQLDDIVAFYNTKPNTFLVVELEFASRQKPNEEGQICFEFPVILQIRNDKEPKECIYGE